MATRPSAFWPPAVGPSARARRGSVPGNDRRQTSISLQADGAGRSRRLPYDYVLGALRARGDCVTA